MASLSHSKPNHLYHAYALCRLIGSACLLGFIAELLVLAFPFSIGNVGWRIGFIQHIGERSIILLFGLALVMYGIIHNYLWRKRVAQVCIILGVVSLLCCILIVRDSMLFKQQALSSISTQAERLQAQIQKLQDSSKINSKSGSMSDQLQKAPELLNQQVEASKKNAETNVSKTTALSVVNLGVLSLALLGLGRYGINPSKT